MNDQPKQEIKMGFFSSKKETETPVKRVEEVAKPVANKVPASNDMIRTPTNNLSIIKENFVVQATIKGKGSLVVGGEYEGDITIDDTLFIEKGAKFNGTVHAKNVKISGEFSGTLYATATEVTKSGKFNGSVNANKTSIGGVFDGIVRSIDSLEITNTGSVTTKECKSKQIKIEGKVKGRVVASELLEVTSGGSIDGEIITKGIRTEQGGSIIGNIQTYDEKIHGTESIIDEKIASKSAEDVEIDPEIAKLIKIKPDDMKKYAKRDESGIKRIPAEKK